MIYQTAFPWSSHPHQQRSTPPGLRLKQPNGIESACFSLHKSVQDKTNMNIQVLLALIVLNFSEFSESCSDFEDLREFSQVKNVAQHKEYLKNLISDG